MIISHISDIHLPIIINPNFHDLFNKRLIGFINYLSKRRKIHDIESLKVIFDDIISNPEEHTVLTGDLVNLSLRSEFETVSDFLGNYFFYKRIVNSIFSIVTNLFFKIHYNFFKNYFYIFGKV